MSDETPWAHLQSVFAAHQPFEDALPGLLGHGLTAEDMGVLLNNPSSELVAWMHHGAGDNSVVLNAVEPPADAKLPERRSGKRGLFGWLTGSNAIEGLGLFTESDVFELKGVQFAISPEPLKPVVYGDLVLMRVLALNCNTEFRSLTVRLEAERGVVQSTRRFVLSLEPGVISLAVLPVRVCPTSAAVVPVVPLFEVDGTDPAKKWSFSARPYAEPAGLRDLVAGASQLAAAAGLSPVYLRSKGPIDQGSPEPIRLRPSLREPMVAPHQAAALWRILTLT